MAEGAGLSGAISGANKGKKIGSLAGTAIGSIIPGGAAIGKKIGSMAGSAIGGGAGAIGSLRKQKQAERDSEIGYVDQEQLKRQQALDMASRNISAGADALTTNKIGQINRGAAQTQNAISRVSGGDVGATQQGLLQAQRNAGQATNIALTDRGNLPYFQGLAQQIASKTSQRRLELDLIKRQQSSAEYAQGQTNKNLNTNAALPLADGDNLNSLATSLSDRLAKRRQAIAPQVGEAGQFSSYEKQGMDVVPGTEQYQQTV
jgi:hypothetical protein